jgi:hypothetical protein
MTSDAPTLRERLSVTGYVHVPGPVDTAEYRRLAEGLGIVVQEELICLRPDAHAYVAKPGRVPLHTDQAQISVVAWHCEEQDPDDGASLLLDTRAVVESLSAHQREVLRHVELACPPVSGGPPTLRFAVLRQRPVGDAVFCSPWLQSADPLPVLVRALDDFRRRLSDAAATRTVRVRLRAGDALFVDNQRVLHGRDSIADTSVRRLRRLWIV